jgi:hypothetical protein
MKTLGKEDRAFLKRLSAWVFNSRADYEKAVREFLCYRPSQAIPVRFERAFEERSFTPNRDKYFEKLKSLWENLPS